jgi:flavin reductase (DIM6/NTAB) family NADH-FMN oxidoreductase RutF
MHEASSALPAPSPASSYESWDIAARGVGAAYQILNAIIVPRPIAFVTTVAETGVVNAAPFSYFNGVTASPPMISISIGRRGTERKDTSRNLARTGEFVVNVSTVALARALSVAAGDFPADVSEAQKTGLALLPGQAVRVPRIANSPVHLECILDRIIEVGDGPVDLVLGRVVLVHVRKDLLDEEGRIVTERLDPLARLAGLQFAPLGPPFEVPRGES